MAKKCEHEKIKSSCPSCSSEQALKKYERAAKRRNILFSLTLTQFEKLTDASCVFCGEQPSLGVDRKDSRIGYNFLNSQSCCGFCNRLKSDFIQENFLIQVQKIAAYQEQLRQQRLRLEVA